MRPLHPLVSELKRSLAHYNSTPPSAEPLRLRVVVHAGEVQCTEDGFAGEDLDVAFGLLSARSLRHRLAGSGADLTLILSDQVYRHAVADPNYATVLSSCRSVRVKIGQDTVRAWVHFTTGGETDQVLDTGTPGESSS
jgi:hypothetical protein